MTTYSSSHFRLVIVDLFCGGGGFSTGMVRAIVRHYRETIAAETGLAVSKVTFDHPAVHEWLGENVCLIGVNHWDAAVETFQANHPWARVLNANVHTLHPPAAVTVEIDGESVTLKVDILIGGPSCIPWSKANNGMAKDGQLRMSPRKVADWIELLRPTQFLVENVEGLQKWGPMYCEDGEMKMEKDGSMFEDWIETLERLGYAVDYDTFYASDYGDAQSRKRLFVMGRLNYEPEWPTPTHSPDGTGDTKPYRTAETILDTEDLGMSIWTRDRDHPRVHSTLKYTTMHRIADGVRRHCDDRLEPFADALDSIGRVANSDDVDADDYTDVEDLRAGAVHVSEAIEAVENRDEPFLVYGDVEEPPGEVDERYGLCVPYVLGQHSGSVPRDATERPCMSVATGGAISYIEPQTFVLPRNGRYRDEFSNAAYEPSEQPAHTVTAKNHDGHVVTAHARRFTVQYNGNSTSTPTDVPLKTVRTKERHALIVPEALPWGLDVRFRLLKPEEVARAQGFPEGYEFAADTKEDHRKLIGNAVPVNLAESFCRSLLEPTSAPTLNKFTDEGPQPVSPAPGGEVADD